MNDTQLAHTDSTLYNPLTTWILKNCIKATLDFSTFDPRLQLFEDLCNVDKGGNCEPKGKQSTHGD